MTSGRPLVAPAQIRHKSSLRRRDLVNVKVFPGDGRAIETFAFDAQELRRFAWAILADYDQEEAKACAAESGLELTSLVGSARLQTIVANPAPRRAAPVTPGGDLYNMLQAIDRQGVASMGALKAVTLAGKSSHKAVVNNLRERGLVERVNEGRQGSRALFEITDAGRATLKPATIDTLVARAA